VLDANAPDTLNALGEALAELRAHHVPLNATLGQVDYTRQTGIKTPIAGCFGCFETINASHDNPGDDAPYGQIIFGDSLLMFTELRKQGPSSEGTLTYSQATARPPGGTATSPASTPEEDTCRFATRPPISAPTGERAPSG